MIYFVSGHRDLTKEEFEEHYVPLIQKVMTEDQLAEFVVIMEILMILRDIFLIMNLKLQKENEC